MDPELRGGPDYPFFRTVIARLWPECLREPINPKPPLPWAKRVRRIGGKILRKMSE